MNHLTYLGAKGGNFAIQQTHRRSIYFSTLGIPEDEPTHRSTALKANNRCSVADLIHFLNIIMNIIMCIHLTHIFCQHPIEKGYMTENTLPVDGIQISTEILPGLWFCYISTKRRVLVDSQLTVVMTYLCLYDELESSADYRRTPGLNAYC